MLKNTAASHGKMALSIIEAAHIAGIGRSTLYEAMAAGELKAVKLGRRTLIPADELRRFIDALPAARPEPKAFA